VKKTLFKNVRKACALMLAIMLLFSCVVNAAPVAQLTAKAAAGDTITIVGAGNVTWGEVDWLTGDSFDGSNWDGWAAKTSVTCDGSRTALITIPDDSYTFTYIKVYDSVVGSNVEFAAPAAAATYYICSDGTVTTTNPADSFQPYTVSVVGLGQLTWAQAGIWIDSEQKYYTVDTSGSTSNEYFSISVSGNTATVTVTSSEVTSFDVTVYDSSLGANAWGKLASAGTYYVTEDSSVNGGFSATPPAPAVSDSDVSDSDVSDSDVSDSDVSDSDVSGSDVSDSDVSDSDAPQTGSFTIDTSNFSGNVWGSFTDGTGTKQWYNWDDQSVVSQSWAGNICTLLVQAAVQNLTVSVGSLPEVSVEFDEHYYSTADGVVTELPSDDDTSDSDVSDSDVSDSDVSDSDVPEDLEFVTGSFKINTGAAPGDVWGSYTDENGNTQWYNWGDQSVIAQSWSGYVCTLTVVGKAANITVSCGTMAEIPAQIGGYYFSTSEGVVEGDAPVYNTPTTSTTTEVAEGVDASVVIHYVRADGNYDGWGVGIWGEVAPGVWKDETIMFNTNNDGQGVAELDDKGFDKDGYKVAIISLSEYPVEQLGFKLHQNNWAVEDQWNKDRYIDVSGLEDGDVLNVYIYEGEEKIFYDNFDETLHGKFLAASSGSVLGAFASRSAESTNIGTIAISVICVVLAGAGVAVLAWYMTSNREKEAA